VPAVTLLGSATFSTASGTKTVTATPAVGDLIVIITAHTGNLSTASPTDDNSSGTYTRITGARKASSADAVQVFVRDALIGSAVSTVFTHAPGTSSGGGLAVLKVTGMTATGAAAVIQSAIQENQASGGTPAPVFGAAPSAANAIIGAVFNATSPATMTPRTNFTERADVGYSSPTTGLEVMSRDSGETATTQTWGSASGSAFSSLVIELVAGSQELSPSLFTNSQTFFAPTVTANYSLAPNRLDNSQTFQAAAISAVNSLTPPLLNPGQTFPSAVITGGGASTQNLAPGLFTNSNSFPAPTVLATYSLAPSPQTSISELISNGTFDVDTAGWTAGSNTIAASGGRMQVTKTGAATPKAYQAIPTTVGKSYRAVGNQYPGTGVTGRSFRISSTVSAGGDVYSGANNTDLDTVFTAITTTTYIEAVGGGSIGQYSEFDNISCKEVALPAATVTPGAVNLNPSLLSPGNTLFAAAVAGNVTLAPGQLTNSQTFNSATVTSAYTLSPPKLTTGSFFNPTVLANYTLSPAKQTNSQTFYAAAVSAANIFTPSLLTTGNLYSPAVSSVYGLAPPKLTNSQTFYSATIFLTQSLLPGLLTNSQSFKVPTVTPGAVSMTPSLFGAGASIKLPSALSVSTLLPPKLTLAQVFHTPAITTSYTLAAGLLSAGGSLKLPTVTSAFILAPPLLTNLNGFPTPVVFRPLNVGPGFMPVVNLIWLGKVRPQVFVSPVDPETGRLDDPSPAVHDTTRY
jgi:hypothetical protein